MARGDDTEISDVDIVVIMPPKLFNMVRLKEDLEELLGLPVDIIRYREQMFAPLKQSIDEEAIYV